MNKNRLLYFIFLVVPAFLIRCGLKLYAIAFILNSLPSKPLLGDTLIRVGVPLLFWGIVLLLPAWLIARVFKKKALASLDEQSAYLQQISWTAFFSPFLWLIVNRCYGRALISLVPLINIYFAFKLALKGPTQIWEKKKIDFNHFQKRQRHLRWMIPVFYIFWMATSLFFVLLYTTSTMIHNVLDSLALYMQAFVTILLNFRH